MYYTPKEEEFHKGFEYEYKHNNLWIKAVSGRLSEDILWGKLNLKGDYSDIRVKCLDKSDIESLGWKFSDKTILQASNGHEYQLAFIEDGCWVGIYNTTLKQGVFNGQIKNKSELIKVKEQLGIRSVIESL